MRANITAWICRLNEATGLNECLFTKAFGFWLGSPEAKIYGFGYLPTIHNALCPFT